MTIDIDTFVTSYLETALWSSTDNSDDSGGKPLDDTYDTDDIAPESLAQAAKECADFISLAGDLLVDLRISGESAGHDFWLTRNGHGAGFWDRGYPETFGAELTKIAHSFGSCDVYIGDDGKLHLS